MGSQHVGKSRLPGRKVALGLAAMVLTVFLTAVLLFFAGREPRGEILALRAMKGGDALVLRRGFSQRKAVHLVRYDREGTLVWSEALFGVQPEGVPFVVGDRVIVPAREARGHATTHVFRVDDGSFLFRGDPVPESVSPDATARYAADDARLFELYTGDPGRLAAYDLVSGERAYAVELPAGETELDLMGGMLVVDGVARLAFDRATGASVAIEAIESAEATAQEAALPAVTLDADGCLRARLASGASEAASVATRDGALATLRPEHVAEDVVFLRTDRDLVGLSLPGLSPPRGYDGPIEVSAASGACVGLAALPSR